MPGSAMLLKPLPDPLLGLLGGVQLPFQLGDVEFLGQLTDLGASGGPQAHQVVSVQ